jgi:hypothetical protein
MIYNIPTLSYEGLEKRIKDTQKKMMDSVSSFEEIEAYKQTKEYKKGMKKILKSIYLKERYSLFEKFGTEHLINHIRNQRDYDSWEDCFIFNTTDLEIVKKELEEMYVEIEGSEPFFSAYDCTGRTMYNPCNFYQFENRTFVCQSGSLDV